VTTVLGEGAAEGRRQADRHWLLFVDWCTATGRSSLPADPDTVAAFLAELPAGAATIARRARAIDAAHRAAGHPSPSEAHELDEVLGRHPDPPRFDPDLVAWALQAIPVGGWPTGIVGRRDAAIVAFVCIAGLTRTQVQTLRTGPAQGPPLGRRDDLLGSGHGSVDARCQVGERGDPIPLWEGMARSARPGSCPACAVSRWVRVAAALEERGWRAVRAELADYGESPAEAEVTHDCARPFAWTVTGGGRSPLVVGIDRHGTPETGWAISTRAITGIVADRLRRGEQTKRAEWVVEANQAAVAARGGERLPWGREQRRRAAERFAEVEATLDEMEQEAEAIMARVHAAMGDELPGRQQG